MSTREPSSYSAADLADPTIDAATLASLAQHRPDLRPLVQQHPNCYPELVTWIAAQEPVAPVAAQPLVAEREPDAAAQPAAAEQEPDATQRPTVQAEPAVGEPATPVGPAEPVIPAPEQSAQPASAYPGQAQPAPAYPGQAQPAPAALPTAEQWAAQFQQTNGREPSMSEYQAALAEGQIAGQRTGDPSLQQFSAGARQMASGAKDFFTTHIAPAAAEAARTVTERTSEARTSPSGWRAWLPFALPALGLLGLLSVFLPAVSASGGGFSISASYIQSDDGTGVILLVLMLLVMAAGVAALIVRQQRWAELTAPIVAIVAGAIALLMSIISFASIGSMGGIGFGLSATPGFGLILLLIVSLALIATGVLLLIGRRKPTPPPASPYAPQPPTA